MTTIPPRLFTAEEFAALDDTAMLDGLDIVPGFSAPVARIFG